MINFQGEFIVTTAIRSTITFALLLILCGAAFAQGQTGNGAASPTVTGTASTDRVRYVSMGEVQQTRLQVFSPDGAQVFDSGFRSGNLLDWNLADQQGARVKDGSYLFVVTVRDFTAQSTQKYGTAVIERDQVYLEQTNRAELSAPQASALEAGRESKELSPIDRIGAAGLNRAAINMALTENNSASSASSKSNTPDGSSATAAASLAGTGSQNKLSKWIDNIGTLGDSAIFENSGNVGIGTTAPANRLDVVRGTPGSMAKSFYEMSSFEFNGDAKLGIYSSSPTAPSAGLTFGSSNLQVNNKFPGFEMQYIYGATAATNQSRFNYVERDATGQVINYAANLFTIKGDGAVTLAPVTSGVAASPRLGIGNNNPQEALDVNGNVRVNGAGNGIIFSDGTKLTSANISGTLGGANLWTGSNVFAAGLSANNTIISNVANPINVGDATNKAYVDANFIKFTPGAEQLSVGDANGTAPMLNLRGGSTCCSSPGGHTPAWFKVFQNGSFVATGNLGIGISPMQGKGYRTSWDSYKGAFRSGYADNEWDDATVGFFSWSGGSNSTASGLYALAFGDTNFAESTSSIVFGSGNQVKGAAGFSAGAGNRVCDTYGVALGNNARSGGPFINGKCDPDSFNIRGLAAVAIGYNVTADQDHTMALGKFASNNGFSGTFIWSDGSATASADTFRNTANNEFAVRATGGVRFRTNFAGTTGCNLPAGSGVFNCTSSRTTKENFLNISGEDVLTKLRNVPVSSWNYISEGKQVRHIGPMAEDFFLAFNLGTGSTSIGVQDLGGVNLAATKALDERTIELQQKTAALEQKTAEVEQLRNRVNVLEERLANIEKVIQKSQSVEGAKAQ
jgi:hypothetical protein